MGTSRDLSIMARALLKEQIAEWDLAAKNYKGLEHVIVKRLTYDGFYIDVQFNPERILSSAAKVDAKSIEARPCFLCSENLPKAQKGILFENSYQVLVNPFPIFKEHLTVPKLAHENQLIEGNFYTMLLMARELNDFTVFYNGPRCGASAPDHFHFQAGIKGFLPIETEFKSSGHSSVVFNHQGVSVWGWKNYQRGIISITGNDANALTSVFETLYEMLKNMQPNEVEPMLNILALFENDEWVVHVFPRRLHRPSQYFAEGDQQIVLSPASVDMGGVVITPRKEDFEKITEADVSNIFEQVCMPDEVINSLLKQLEISLHA
jgi:ATP adenylyltransferase/5',5'''-P-1,P-4-tetraphosphate phosphorylase II